MAKVYTIKKADPKNIHAICSPHFDRDIVFRTGTKYAVVLSHYYGGKGYTTHKSASAVVKQAHKMREYSHRIIDSEGYEYIRNGDEIISTFRRFQ